MMNNLEIIRTSHLILSELTINDANFIFKLYNDRDFIRYIGDKGIASVQDAESFILQGPINSYKINNYGLCLISLLDKKPIGICGLLKRDKLDSPDIGFAILPNFRKQGYAVEASRAILNDARERLQLTKILAITSSENIASIELLLKLGMVYKKMLKIDSDSKPVQLYSIQFN